MPLVFSFVSRTAASRDKFELLLGPGTQDTWLMNPPSTLSQGPD